MVFQCGDFSKLVVISSWQVWQGSDSVDEEATAAASTGLPWPNAVGELGVPCGDCAPYTARGNTPSPNKMKRTPSRHTSRVLLDNFILPFHINLYESINAFAGPNGSDCRRGTEIERRLYDLWRCSLLHLKRPEIYSIVNFNRCEKSYKYLEGPAWTRTGRGLEL
jgi:hypothetical protein